MSLVPLKYIVTAVALETDDDGLPTGERQTEPAVFYGRVALLEWLTRFEQELAGGEPE